jgi:hypothetical protein
MRTWIVAAALLIAGADAAANEYALERARTLYNQLRDRAQCEAALPEARAFWRSSDFRTLRAEVQTAFLNEVMICAWDLEDSQGAIAASRAARELGADWADYALMQIGLRFGDDALAVESFHALTSQSAARLKDLRSRFVFSLLQAARSIDSSGAAELRIHETLAAANYAPPEGYPDDSLRVSHARLLLARGEVERARARVATVLEPREVMTMRVSRTFDPLRGDPEFERRLDVLAAAQAHAERARLSAQRSPRSLSLVNEYAQALHVLGRLEEALAELDRVIPLAQADDADERFDDVADALNWLLNEKAYLLYDLGRADDARSAFGLSIAAGESGEWSVSQVINFASMLEAEGRPADALQVLHTVGRASPYGDMWVAAVRACAAEQLGDETLRRESLAFLRTHEADNVAARTRALLCVNDLDAAAEIYVRRLGNAEEREAALLALQIYRLEAETLPRKRVLAERQARVRERPEVRAAIDAVGRIEETPLISAYWGDF